MSSTILREVTLQSSFTGRERQEGRTSGEILSTHANRRVEK
jgi:hypothetical protein